MKREEQKLIREIKQAAAKNNTPTVRVLAKSLVRLRGQQARLAASAAQMRGVSSSMVVSILSSLAVIPVNTGWQIIPDWYLHNFPVSSTAPRVSLTDVRLLQCHD